MKKVWILMVNITNNRRYRSEEKNHTRARLLYKNKPYMSVYT